VSGLCDNLVPLERIADALDSLAAQHGAPQRNAEPHPFDKLCMVSSAQFPLVACVNVRGHGGPHAWEQLLPHERHPMAENGAPHRNFRCPVACMPSCSYPKCVQ
jgi:hypothetical protein